MQLYTIKLDKNKATISEADAMRLADEITRESTSNPHLAEERGHIDYREAVSFRQYQQVVLFWKIQEKNFNPWKAYFACYKQWPSLLSRRLVWNQFSD